MTNPANQAQVLGLMDDKTIGAQGHLAVIDQGQLEGVRPEQSWLVAEPVADSVAASEQIKISRARGQVEILQVFPHFSVVRIYYSEREVMRGTYLRQTAQTSLRSR